MVSKLLLKHQPKEFKSAEVSGQLITLSQILDRHLLDWEGALFFLDHALLHTNDYSTRARIFGWMTRLHALGQILEKAFLAASNALEEVKNMNELRFEFWMSDTGYALVSDLRVLCATVIFSGIDEIDHLQKCLDLLEIAHQSLSTENSIEHQTNWKETTRKMFLVVNFEISVIQIQVLQGLSDFDGAQKKSDTILRELATWKSSTGTARRELALRSELFEVCALQDIIMGTTWHASRLLQMSLVLKLEAESKDDERTTLRGLTLAEIRDTLKELKENRENVRTVVLS